ncbi:MAG: alpha-galactosidase [Lachnospiraceae bacterium]|nr:alpha-galactosidase [Lachnospiraceae bacterium]
MSIIYNPNKRIFSLHTKNTTYQMMVDKHGYLLHLYYGSANSGLMDYVLVYTDRGFSGNPYVAGNDRTYSLDTLPQEYPTLGTGDFRNYALNIENSDGSQCCNLKFSHYEIKKGKYSLKGLPAVWAGEDEADTLEIVLKDSISKIEVSLFYGVLAEDDIITRSAIIRNAGEEKVIIKKAAGACLDFLTGDFDVVKFYGKHAMERNVERMPVGHGTTSFGSRRGTSSHQYNPAVILSDRNTTEDFGSCYGLLFAYSGNFLCEVEKDQVNQTRVLMGLNDDLFSYPLGGKEEFTVPEVILSYSRNGFAELSHNYHSCIRKHLCRGRYVNAARPVLINSWEAAYFDFNGDTIVNLAKEAAGLGIDMVVMDDGWFGKRNDDNSSLGDWNVNEEKLGCTLAELIHRINELGVKFGIWIEPEMVNEDSELYRKHPDWVIKIENRDPVRSRNQLVLDFSRKEVRDSVFEQICAMLDQGNIEYIKWDMNRSMADVYAGNVTYDYVLGVYDFLEKLTSKYPEILLEGCSGGGGRFDAGMMYYCPQIWCSDNTDAINRTKIQYGSSFFYPVSVVGSHVSAVPNHQTGRITSLNTRGITAMAGTFGYEMNPALLSEEDKAVIREQVMTYKKHEMLICQGDYYRLSNPFADEHSAWMFVSEDKKQALVNIVRLDVQGNMAATYVKLKGLKKEAVYIDDATGNRYTGAALMEAGLPLPFPKAEYEAYQIALKELDLARNLYEVINKQISAQNEKNVISIFGGSGCGKTTLASIISQYFLNDGIGCYVLAGDNYPRRIPKLNDEERQRIYEEKGTDGLTEYLGTPNEIEFDEVNQVIAEFKSGESAITLKQMGREEGEISYDKADFHDIRILLIEWTHGGSEFLSGVDLPVYIDSVPEDTLHNRVKRNRDKNAASELIKIVLDIEQKKLQKQAKGAKIIVDRDGGIYEQ